MRFTAAALLMLAATPACEAFLPAKTASFAPAAFLPRPPEARLISPSLHGLSGPVRFFLRSTTEDDLELLKHALKNNIAATSAPSADTRSVFASSTTSRNNNNNNNATPKPTDAESAQRAAEETRAAATAYIAQYEGQSGASIIYTKLVENGVTVVNGFSGGAVLPLLDQFHEDHPRHQGREPYIRWITNSNESSAGHIAEGYGKSMPLQEDGGHLPVGVVVATSGPGLTNLITPLQDAICDGVPMLALCGQAATNAPKDAFQFAPAVELTTPCTKWSYKIKSAAELPMVMDYAFYVARNGRPGPVFVDLPKDLQNQVLTTGLIDSFVQNNLSDAANKDHDQDESRFCRMTQRRRADGSVFQALHLGTGTRKLPFDIVKTTTTTKAKSMLGQHPYRLDAVTLQTPGADQRDDHHADHSPTHQIFKFTPDGTMAQQDDLDAASHLSHEILNLIAKARKPVILAGQGCNDAPADLKAFAETLQIPVATTLHALGCFDERNELALNMVGMHGHPTPNFMFQQADLIICVGSRFDDRITGRMGSYVPEARRAAEEGRGGIIHVDIRRTERAKQLTPTFFVHSTGKRFLQTMNAALQKKNFLQAGSGKPITTMTAAWLKHMKELQAEFPVKIPYFPPELVTITNEQGQDVTIPRTRLSAQSVVAELNRQLLEAGKMDEAIFTTGVGVHQMVAAQLITWTKPRQMLSSGSLGTMGVALGYAIGAQLANGKKIVIAVDGDGSFNMTFTELKTLAEQKIPVKIMIIDNDGQMMVEYWQRLFHDNRLLAVRNSHNPDYSILASAFGIKSIHCAAQEDLQQAMKEFLFADPGEPVLFHVRVERTPCLPLVAPGQPLDDMILEDVEVDVDGAAAPS